MKPESEGDNGCIKSSRYHCSLDCLCVLVQSTFFVSAIVSGCFADTRTLQIDKRKRGEEYWFYLRRYSMLINWISHCGD